ncbi:hypothetical protein [uncultured Imperialibacter sp.]|uniref:hypothetical protein n=1 Tax=uncultured Imperialibacter sp. TaxID=1672639 RepID=UPI0030DC8B4A
MKLSQLFTRALLPLLLIGCASPRMQRDVSEAHAKDLRFLMENDSIRLIELDAAKTEKAAVEAMLLATEAELDEARAMMERFRNELAEPIVARNPIDEVYDSLLAVSRLYRQRYVVANGEISRQEQHLADTLAARQMGLRQQISELSEVEFDGELLVNCPSTMLETVPETITAVVSKVLNRQEIIGAIATAQNITIDESADNTTAFRVVLTDKIRLSVEFDPADFELLSEAKSFERTLSEDREEWFDWYIKPLRPGSNKQLVFVLENLGSNGEWLQRIPAQRREIEVGVKASSFFVNVWVFIRENPEWALTSIIIPIVTFLVGWWKGRKKKKKEAPV